VNALIRTVLLQERTGSNTFGYDGLTLQYKLDNEFELVFVVAYQKILQLSYIDKFLDCIHLEFRDKYKDDLLEGNTIGNFSFADEFTRVLRSVEEMSKRKAKAPKKMKTYEQSVKSQKTVASMIERKDDVKSAPKPTKEVSKKPVAMAAAPLAANGGSPPSEQDQILINRMKFFEKQQPRPKPKEKALSDKKSPKANAVETKKSKQARQWEHGGTNKDIHVLDFSNKEQQQNGTENNLENITAERVRLVGKMKGEIKGMEVESDEEEEEEEVQEEEVVKEVTVKGSPSKGASTAKGQPAAGFGMFNVFKSLVGSKVISDEDMRPVLDRMRDHLIGKNVAIDIADQLCQSVGKKLEGKVLGTFSGVASTVRASLTEACMQILLPQRRVDILRDVMEAQRTRRPYTVTFCGVNGVGKSTNLAKVTFWLVENGFRVLIAACDTFRAGAVEQLRTHTRHLNALHPPDTHAGVQMVQLYEKGYGKDAAGIAMEAINYDR
ncbi:PREDICTED: signal recognition particle receptor subunit alpha-like, partial [Priapulus caudatus]|uniref:Signal recognition particle receptor subunit alpha-like n=1 Tax=Priapulus caudatus TaxID=37621 RepID=A0ABM1ELR1_PRICU